MHRVHAELDETFGIRPIKTVVDEKHHEDQDMIFPQWKEAGLPNEQTDVASQEEGYEEISLCLFRGMPGT
jgi:hypothetical protein